MTEARAITDALLSGSLDELPEETSFLFARCGVLYLFTAAGFHLAAAARVADFLSWPVRRALPDGRAARASGLVARLLLFAWVALAVGAASPMARALTYTCLRAGAEVLELRADRRWLFTLSLLAGAVLGPGGLYSFLFSACALAGLLFLEPRRLRFCGPWLCTLPLTAWRFGLVPLLGPLWGLAAGALAGLGILPLALAARLLESLGLPLPFLSALAERGAELLAIGLRLGDGALGGALWVRAGPFAFLSAVLFMAAALRAQRPRAALGLAAASAMLALAIPLPVFSALDVGQGDGLFLRAGENTLLEDAGPIGLHGREAPVCRRLERLGIGALGDLLLSHFDLDHRGGLPSLLARHPVRGALWFREEDLGAKGATPVLLAAERAGAPVRFLSEAAAPAGLLCRLAPYREGNDSSPLCLASLEGGRRLLLTGDMSEKAEDWFLARLSEFPRADYLKVAHHGSRTSSTLGFLRASGAREAFVSVGARNRYGHPAPETLARLEEAGLRVRRTDWEGDLSVYPPGWMGYLSALIEESMRPAPSEVSRVKPGNPATARWLYAGPAFVK